MHRLYFDHNATSPLRTEVKEALVEFINANYGNPSSIHGSGRAIRAKVDEARENIAKLIGANTLEIIFTSSGVEANHLAWHAFQSSSKKIATTTTEHNCIRGATTKAEICGAQVHLIPVERDGSISEKSIQDLAAFKPDFVSIHHANNETGTLYPIASYSKLLKEKNACYFHSDAVQTVGKSGVNVKDLGVDYLSISGHKLGALQGIGALYVKKGSPLKSLWPGGTQEKGIRSGTENVLGIISMGVAAKVIMNAGNEEQKRVEKLRDEFEKGMMQIPGISITAQKHKRIPNTSHIIFENLDAESLLIAADLDHIDIATGSACSSGAVEPSKVVLAMGVDHALARGAVRFSFGWNTTQSDIEKALRILPKLVEQVRKNSSV